MRSLSRDDFTRAAEFVREQARPLDRSRFEYHFGGAPRSAVLRELSEYQNPDGGFGYGLEPDITLPNSSAIATSIAFQILCEVDAGPDEPLARRGVEYLISAYDARIEGWEEVPPEVTEFPRAPWWDYKPADPPLSASVWGNPGAEIVGYLHRYSRLVPDELLARTTERALAGLAAFPGDMEVHTALCYARTGETLSGAAGQKIRDALRAGIHTVVSSDVASWSTYGVRPLWFAPTPDSFLVGELREGIQRQLDFEIDRQLTEGCWDTFWQWGRYEDAWQIAKVQWQDSLTMQNLLALKAWGRIEGL